MGFYVVSDDKCFYEGMTKEQILTAITQAIETHQIANVDTGFVTTLKEANQNKPMSFWVGTTAEYNAIEEKLDDCIYLLTDDTELEDLEALIRRSMNVLKGEIIIDRSDDPIPFSGILSQSIPLTGEHEIWEFSLVQVVTSNWGTFVCAVTPSINISTQQISGANIHGVSSAVIQSATASDCPVILNNITIYCQKWSDDTPTVITRNESISRPIYDPSSEYSTQGIGIKKIIGLM